MNEINDAFTNFNEYRAKKEATADKAKKIAAPYVFKLMGELGVEHLVVTYAGEGDSGCWQSVLPAFYTAEEAEDVDACEANNWYAKTDEEQEALDAFRLAVGEERDWSDWPEKLDRHDWEKTFRDVIGELALWWAPDGFEINDGGHGIVYFDSKNRTVEAEDYARVIDYHQNTDFNRYE